MSARNFFAYSFPLTREPLMRFLWATQWATLRFYKDYDKEAVDFLRSVYREREILMQPNEAYFLYALARRQASVAGDFAEVGTYKGGSSKILCQAKGDKNFYGFDTFEGLPQPQPGDTPTLKGGEFRTQKGEVEAYLSAYPSVHIITGTFPGSAGMIMDKRFSLVHLDVDLYETTKAGLDFFWDRLSPDGAIIIHDMHFAGIRQAIAEFTAAHPDCLGLLTTTTQWVVWKHS